MRRRTPQTRRWQSPGGDARATMRRLAGAMAALIAGVAAAPSPAADVVKGNQVYMMHCAACHGMSGVSVMPGAPNFARLERLLQPDAALLASIRNGRNAMPAYAGILTDREILDVIAYLRTLRQ